MFTLRGRPAAAAAITLIGLAAAGCSSSASSSSSPTATATTTVTASAPASSSTAVAPSSPSGGGGTTACPTSSLQVKQSAPNGYAGGVYVNIVFTNASNSSCTLYGYPGVSLVSASHTQIGLSATRLSTVPVKLVTLASGATASALVQIADAVNFPSPTCGSVKAAYLRIFPPNQTAPVYLANTSRTCAKPVPTLTVTAVQAGSGNSS